MEHLKRVSRIELYEIIDNKKPLGTFWTKHAKLFTAVDNRTGEAWTEEFSTYKQCSDWLQEPL